MTNTPVLRTSPRRSSISKSPLRRNSTEKEKPRRKVQKSISAFNLAPFVARPSLLDYETLLATNHPMRGFFTLFWVTLALGVLNTSYKHFMKNGTFVSLRLAVQLTNDGYDLLLADGAMVLSLYMCVLFQTIFCRGWVPYKICLIIQVSLLYAACLASILVCILDILHCLQGL
jgi:hypothetical protein